MHGHWQSFGESGRRGIFTDVDVGHKTRPDPDIPSGLLRPRKRSCPGPPGLKMQTRERPNGNLASQNFVCTQITS